MSITSSTENTKAFTSKAPRVRLDYLDGLRGLAALYIVLFHLSFRLWALVNPFPHSLLAKGVFLLNTLFLSYGHYAVPVFIVLSGYCLMLPVVRNGNGTLPKGFMDFMRRRARRILPPYYAALVLFVGYCLIAPRIGFNPHLGFFREALPVWKTDVLLPHLFSITQLDALYRQN